MSHDHYIYAAHIRQWAIKDRISVLRRGQQLPKTVEVGRLVAAEPGLNDPLIEVAYGKIENAFIRALPRLLDPASKPTGRDWQAVREYAVLMHDRYPRLRGSAADARGLPGGNAMMVPNPANWGRRSDVSDSLSHLATMMDREQLKAARLQFVTLNAGWLPPLNQVFYVRPVLLGDAGIHAITFHPDKGNPRTYVAMPLSPLAVIVFGNERAGKEEVLDLVRQLNRKVARESTVVIDTPEASIIKHLSGEMWSHQPKPSGAGLPKAVHVWDRIEDIPDPRRADIHDPEA